MKKITIFLLTVVVMLFATIAFSQSTVTGTIMDTELNSPLPGANIVEKGTTNGTTSDFDGNFKLTTQSASGEVVISYVGYTPQTIAFSGNQNLGNVSLVGDNTLEEIVIVGTGVIDLAEGRKTPVAVSTIKAEQIQKKIGTQDITATLVNTPSVYVAGQSGGFGDSRIAVRGFEQDNTAYLLNGQPINGMEDGKMYWSNWSGMNDIASAVQIQRGLGSSKLAISSVGGTTNFVTKTTDKRESGFAYVGIANDNYLKTTLAYNTGKSEKGFGTSVLLSHWQGDGYNEGNFGQGQNYFISFGYTPNDKHNFNFLITGAPQYHDQNFSKSISTYLERGRKYNNNWGTYRGEYMTSRRNFYHKPVANLNWDFNINETTDLSTVLYASWGRGGGTGPRGRGETTDEGYVDYDAIYEYNLSTSGAGGNFTAEGGYITRSSMNLHNWYGLVTNLEKQLGENLTLNFGFDLRTYYGEHFRIVENFHGLTSWEENITLRDQNNDHQSFGDGIGTGPFADSGDFKNVVTTRSLSANPWAILTANFDQDEKIAYSNDERISYGGLFTQLEYAKDNLSAFFQGSISNQYHQRFDYYQYADQALIDGTSSQNVDLNDDGIPDALPEGITDGVDSEKVTNFGFNVKAGVGYIINDNHKVYVNAGYYDRQPYHDNIFPQFTNQINPFSQNEKILGLEAGYSFGSPNFKANLNLYRTSWKDRVVNSARVVDGSIVNTLNFGVEQLHSGVELDFTYRVMDDLRLNGFASLGDWKYVGSSITRKQDEEQNILSEVKVDVDGGKVGDAAQITAGIGFDYTIVERLSFDADYRFYDKLYADVGAVKENLELPSFDLLDLGVSYKMLLGKDRNNSLNFRLNVNNALHNIYLSELRTNIKTTDLIDEDEPSLGTYASNGEVYNGIATANQGYFGLGRTWNFSLRFKF